MRTRTMVLSVICSLFCLSPSEAQQSTPRIEAGGSAGLLAGIGSGEGFGIFTIGPRVTLNTTFRDGIELVLDTIQPNEDGGIYGMYVVQYKRFLRERVRNRSVLFLTVGGGGLVEYERVAEYREERPDRSVYVQPGYSDGHISAPMFGVIGVGWDYTFQPFAATRAELQAHVFAFGAVGVKATVGISIPIGRGYRD